ncbi:MAG: GreA/GreB family elongation factor [Atopostipes sp.]|nr:GreA/GreB family elongation factor [Atopostipes sp.]
MIFRKTQALVNKEINEIQNRLNLSKLVLPENRDNKVVQLGDTVHFVELNNGNENSYQIVSRHEADLTENKISVESPIGESFLGREVKENWTIKIPNGKMNVRLTKIN